MVNSSPISDESMLRKLSLDADFYLLPKLKEHVDELLTEKTSPLSKAIFAKFDNASHGASGQFWQWNGTKALHPDFFSLTTHTHTNDSIIVKQEGTYMVLVRTAFVNTTNKMYLSLYVNGTDVARCYNCTNINYYASTSINEVFQFKANDRLQVFQTHNNSPLNGSLNNQFSVLFLGPCFTTNDL